MEGDRGTSVASGLGALRRWGGPESRRESGGGGGARRMLGAPGCPSRAVGMRAAGSLGSDEEGIIPSRLSVDSPSQWVIDSRGG